MLLHYVVSILMYFSHYGGDCISILDDTSLFSIVFNAMAIILQFMISITKFGNMQWDIVNVFKSILQIDLLIIDQTIIKFQE